MKHYLVFNLPSGHVFEIPSQVIADDRSAYYHKDHPEEFPTLAEAMADTTELFDDSYEIRDWFLNNMDVEKTIDVHARLIAYNPPPLEWGAAEYETRDEQTPAAELQGETILGAPVELVMNAMAAAGELCQFQMLMDTNTGKPAMAIAFVRGGEQVVGAFANGMQHITNFIADKIEAEKAAALPH